MHPTYFVTSEEDMKSHHRYNGVGLVPQTTIRVVVEDWVRHIPANAFEKCGKLEEVILPNRLETIRHDAFSYCVRLREAVIPDTVHTIGTSAFTDCLSLSEVSLPRGIKAIQKWVFNRCSSLRYVKFPDSVTVIDNYAFSGCQKLRRIGLSSKLTVIGEYAFGWCESLTFVYVPRKVEKIKDNAFSGCVSLTRVDLPTKLRKIGCFASQSCSNLCITEVPSGASTQVGGVAFWNCNTLPHLMHSTNFWTNERFVGMILHHLLYKMSVDDDIGRLHGLQSFLLSKADTSRPHGSAISEGPLWLDTTSHPRRFEPNLYGTVGMKPLYAPQSDIAYPVNAFYIYYVMLLKPQVWKS